MIAYCWDEIGDPDDNQFTVPDHLLQEAGDSQLKLSQLIDAEYARREEDVEPLTEGTLTRNADDVWCYHGRFNDGKHVAAIFWHLTDDKLAKKARDCQRAG